MKNLLIIKTFTLISIISIIYACKNDPIKAPIFNVDPSIHVCYDITHELCDGECVCDGFECPPFLEGAPNDTIINTNAYTFKSSLFEGYIYTMLGDVADNYELQGYPVVAITDSIYYWIKVPADFKY